MRGGATYSLCVYNTQVGTLGGATGLTAPTTASASTSSERLGEKADGKVEIVKEFKFAGEMVK